MATAMTYNSLLTQIQAYLEKGTVNDPIVFQQLPYLINQGERRISRSLKILGFQRPLTNSFTQGSPLLPKPDRWRETISFNFGRFNPNTGQYTRRTAIYPRSYEFIRSYWPDDSVLAAPRFFADYDYFTWIVAPTPDQAYPLEVLFWEMPALLDTTNQQNWLSIYAPEALLYSVLLECTPFLKNDDRIPTWQGLLDQALTALSNEDVQDLVTRATQTRQSAGGKDSA